MTAMPPATRSAVPPRALRVIGALILREMTTSYGRSSLGYLWAILEPVGGVVLLTVAFSLILRTPPIGDSFALFYATGYLPFSLWMRVQNQTMRALRANRQLLFYPDVGYLDAILARFILAMITGAVVMIVVLAGIVVLFGLRVHVDLGMVFMGYLMAGITALGIGTTNIVILHLIPSWDQVWSILTRPLFIASCIFFLFDSLPYWVQDILWFNPIVHCVGLVRAGMFTTYEGTYISIAYPMAVGFGFLLLGLVGLRRFARGIVNT
jgi:capsular polysaccharide transport system permease protein